MAAPESPAGPTVLVADDEAILRRLLQRVLEGSGWSVVLAADGDEALARLAPEAPPVAVAVVDLRMPPDGGLPLLGRMHALAPRMPLVVTSGVPPEEPVRSWLVQKGAVFLQKPFAPEALCELVARLGQRSPA